MLLTLWEYLYVAKPFNKNSLSKNFKLKKKSNQIKEFQIKNSQAFLYFLFLYERSYCDGKTMLEIQEGFH